MQNQINHNFKNQLCQSDIFNYFGSGNSHRLLAAGLVQKAESAVLVRLLRLRGGHACLYRGRARQLGHIKTAPRREQKQQSLLLQEAEVQSEPE